MDAEQKMRAELRATARKAELERLAEDLPAIEEMQKALASYDRAKYQALIDAGFTENQALELIKR